MSEPNPRAANSARRGPIRAMQNFAGGVFLLILAALAIYLARGLPQGSLRSMGPPCCRIGWPTGLARAVLSSFC